MKRHILNANIIVLVFVIAAGFTALFYWQNCCVEITAFEYSSAEIPAEFDRLTIVHVSDLHNKQFGLEQSRLLRLVEEANPDLIAITGDLIDRRRYDLEKAMHFINGAVEIAPVYYVSGNHEAWSGEYPLIKESLIEAGVTILDDNYAELNRDGSKLTLMGVSDPGFLSDPDLMMTDTSRLTAFLENAESREGFKILLSHRPELFNLYVNYGVDLVLTGHAHGGQFRIPGIGGLYAPNQGLFPPYTSGGYTEGTTTMVVSRGLGNSVIPVRLFNRPEILAITLNKKSA